MQSSITRRARGGQENLMEETTNIVIPVLLAFFGWIALMYAIQHSMIAVPFIDGANALYAPIIATFVLGYLVIVLEEQTEINKAATALVLGVMIWVLVGTGLDLTPQAFDTEIKETLEDVSEVVFFLLGALTIVEIMDAHKGFDIITKAITATKARDLLVVISVLTFVLSSVLNNLTVVIVMVSLLQKVVKDVEFRQKLGGVVVVASNAGGAWTPIGDITTTMLYIGGQVTTVPLLANLFLPSVLCLIGCVGYEYIQMDADKEIDRPPADEEEEVPEGQGLVFWGGLGGMVSVPVFTALTQCPPWTGMMLVLGLLGVITSLIHKEDERYSLKGALARVEVPDALFFLGVLFAVGGLERIGLLKAFAIQLSSLIPSDTIVAVLLGFASAVVDNVPLVAATQGMYDLTAHPANDPLWNLITFCAATGGSLLVIGSAAGVAFMGMERGVSFGWYFSQIAPGALVGYFFGIAGILAQQGLGLAVQ
jgi:Na+/H+ antiporter NhaD/arsenite permease-like protein